MNKNLDLIPMTIEEQKNISAGFANVASIIKGGSSLVTGIMNVANDVSDTIIKHKIISKMEKSERGELELSKDGKIKIKWDESNENHLSKSSIIF